MSNQVCRDRVVPCVWLALAVLAALVGCRDVTGPMSDGPLAGAQWDCVAGSRGHDRHARDEGDVSDSSADSGAVVSTHILTQAPGAPPLETYQVSFWVYRDRAASVTVNYQRRAGSSATQPFLWFDVPQDGLKAGGGGGRLARRDSVYVTLTIDPVEFLVDFQPSGVLFDKRHPATLVLWGENANPDLNGDGVVDAADRALQQQVHFLYRATRIARWRNLKATSGWSAPFVWGTLEHFSQYAVSF